MWEEGTHSPSLSLQGPSKDKLTSLERQEEVQDAPRRTREDGYDRLGE